MNGVLVVLAGALLVGGALLLAAGVRRTVAPVGRDEPRDLEQRWARLTWRPAGRAGRRRDVRLLVGLLIGVLVAALTGWVLAVLLVPALVVVLPAILSTPEPGDVALLEALDRWVRSLATTLPTGRSILDAVRLSRRTAPELLAEPLGVLVARLNARWSSRDAFQRFADDLDSPEADGVVAALILASERGSTGAAATLAALADSLQGRLAGRREIETERAKPFIVVRQVTVITLVTFGVFLLLGHAFFAPYATPLGQVVLTCLLTGYFGSLLFLRLRCRPPHRDRILVGRS